MSIIFALETSCDDTAAALVDNEGRILSDVIFSQIKEHAAFGGVVPEVGSRAHIEQISAVVNEAFRKAQKTIRDVDAIACTLAPGLVGPLLVGAQFAKGFSLANDIPFIGVHHIEGHILAGLFEEGFFSPPFLSLVVSGGHSAIYLCKENYEMEVIGETIDDAAGEAFDKIGRALGLSYPAGKMIDELARNGDKDHFSFPIAMAHEAHFNFSFSGVKTSALNVLNKHAPLDNKMTQNFCASLQESICKALLNKTEKALKKYKVHKLVIGGGVAANSRLRSLARSMCIENDIKLYIPKPRLCTDNAVMIAKAAHIRFKRDKISGLNQDVQATLRLEDKSLL